MSDSPDEVRTHDWMRRCELLYDLRLSCLYHQKRSRFFDAWERASQAIAVLGSTAAISQILSGNPGSQLVAAAVVAVSSTVVLVFGTNQKARVHAELARDCSRLIAEIERSGEEPSHTDLDKWRATLSTLEADEPAALSSLVIELSATTVSR